MQRTAYCILYNAAKKLTYAAYGMPYDSLDCVLMDNYKMLTGWVLSSQRKEAEYQHQKKEVAATKLQKLYRGFRYDHLKYMEINFLGNYFKLISVINLKEVLIRVGNILFVDLGLENSISHCWRLRGWKE